MAQFSCGPCGDHRGLGRQQHASLAASTDIGLSGSGGTPLAPPSLLKRLIDFPGLLGLTDVARFPAGSGSGSVIPITRDGLIEYLPAGVARRSPAPAPPCWSLKAQYGDPLFEIFAVYANFPLVGQMKLPPTGPSSYIPADSGVELAVRIFATKNRAGEIPSIVLHWDDLPMSNRCNTASIETSKGVVEVVCAVIDEAMEGGFCVRLCIPCELLCSSSIHGSITARTDMFDPEITIFDRDVESAINLSGRDAHPVPNFVCAESYRHVTLPLVRSSLAVPIQATRVEFDGELMIGSKTLSVKQSILLNAKDIWTPWVKHGECYTSLSLCLWRAP